MKIGGLQKTSLLDYPDTISAIVWTVGCNFCCPFCYNKKLVTGDVELIAEDEVLGFLDKRKGVLEGVVITGGEPFLQKDLEGFLIKVKKMGYLVKVDTNGTFPEELKKLLEEKLVDYVAMDVKAPKNKYSKLSGVKTRIGDIEKSIEIIKEHAPSYEFRTTFVPGLLKKEDIVKIAEWLNGAKCFYLQQFQNNPPLVSSDMKQQAPYPRQYIYETLDAIKSYFKSCEVRGV